VNWLSAVEHLRRQRMEGVLVTVVSVRGHAPRDAGAKMVISADNTWDSIGGGNLEQEAIEAARSMIAGGESTPLSISSRLTEHAPARHGVQCCGGEVTLLLEPLAVVEAVAIFGMGHVGTELARLLARHDLELHLVDSRSGYVDPVRLQPVTTDTPATVHLHHAPVPELVMRELPPGAHVLVMTHDHAEDAALVDVALRTTGLGSIGLIGSSAKWTRLSKRLAGQGHSPADLSRVQTPIGLPELTGKDPATIAVSVAASLLITFERDRAARQAPGRTAGRRPAPSTAPEPRTATHDTEGVQR